MGGTGTNTITGAAGSPVVIGNGTTGSISIGSGSNTVDFVSGSTVDFTGTTVTGLATSSSLPTRSSVSVSTNTIADNDSENVDAVGFKSYMLLAIETSAAAWVRLYTDTTSRTADLTRLQTEDPLPESGVIAEVITAGAEVVKISPGVLGFNFDSPVTTNIPMRITNLSGSSSAITVTVTLLQIEA
jgi:hypothetical protein